VQGVTSVAVADPAKFGNQPYATVPQFLIADFNPAHPVAGDPPHDNHRRGGNRI